MGLDIYLYKVSKVKENLKFESLDDFFGRFYSANYSYIEKNDYDSLPENHLLKNVAKKYSFISYTVDSEEFLSIMNKKGYEEYDIADVIVSKEDIRVEFTDGNSIIYNEKSLGLKISKKETILYVFIKKQIAYQRGLLEVNMRNKGYDYLNFIGNTKYCDSLNLIREMVFQKILSEDFLIEWSDDTLFLAWW